MTAPDVGVPHEVGDGLRMVLAPNPGSMTHWGTNTFLLGTSEIAVIDPGPDDAAHLDAILGAVGGARITHILVTHAHLDHSPLARPLSRRTGAPVLAFGPPEAGRSATMQRLADQGLSGGGEGVDRAFRPDTALVDGDRVSGPDWSLTALHTPGHFAGHLAFDLGDGTLLSGDHAMSWASSLVSPPDGDVAAFMATTRRLMAHGATRLLPAHGPAIEQPSERLDWLLNHRQSREDQILARLGPEPWPISRITAHVYADIPAEMLPAAERNVFAHLIDLWERSLVKAEPDLSVEAQFSRT